MDTGTGKIGTVISVGILDAIIQFDTGGIRAILKFLLQKGNY
jgi:hypothetical protein